MLELQIKSLKASLDILCSDASQVNASCLIGLLDILTWRKKKKKKLIKNKMFCHEIKTLHHFFFFITRSEGKKSFKNEGKQI